MYKEKVFFILLVSAIIGLIVYDSSWFKKEFRPCIYWQERVEEIHAKIESEQFSLQFLSDGGYGLFSEIEEETPFTEDELRKDGFSESEIVEYKEAIRNSKEEMAEFRQALKKDDKEQMRKTLANIERFKKELQNAHRQLELCE